MVGRLHVIGLAWLFVLAAAAGAEAQRAIFLVRHGEKVDDSRDAALSAAGEARAERLAKALGDAGITVLYSSDLQRARNTAGPLATALGLRVTIIARDATSVVRQLRKLPSRETALVVAHSDTLPGILQGLGHRQPIAIADAEYDNLFVVMPRAGAPPVMLRLRY
jgi:broad specificity phosphatase PhoE